MPVEELGGSPVPGGRCCPVQKLLKPLALPSPAAQPGEDPVSTGAL